MRWLVLPALLFLLAANASATGRDDALSGVWQGSYGYGGNDTRPPVDFTLDARVTNEHITGRMSEPNTFGTAGVPFLYASVDGWIHGRAVQFTKTYDGTGGQNHSVQYSGYLDRAHRTITGTWQLQGGLGHFSMTLTH
jgi:hypothetical protein